uniref:Uncharacterized protein n=1 Tax=Echeneis naucrates TaxID=173247 RepID=A0A665TN73_ECHNA
MRLKNTKRHYMSGWSTSLSRWQEFVVTELAPAHHSKENSQRSLTVHRLTETFFLRRSLIERGKSV